MANIVYNKVISTWDVLEKIIDRSEDGYKEVVDFNKLIPMPKDLKIEFSSLTYYDMLEYLKSINPVYNKKANKEEYDKKYQLLVEKLNLQTDIDYDSLLGGDKKIGKKYFNNLVKYGHSTWYTWSLSNWGCKWNASCSSIEKIDNDKFLVTFETAWTPPYGIIEKLFSYGKDKIEWYYMSEFDFEEFKIYFDNGKISCCSK